LTPTDVAVFGVPNILDHCHSIVFQSLAICNWKESALLTDKDVTEHHKSLHVPAILDVKDLAYQSLYPASIINVPVTLKSRIGGKVYQDEQKQEYSRQKTEQTRVRLKWDQRKPTEQFRRIIAKQFFNVFDLIFPILQRPLGRAFDDIISFPAPLYSFQVEGVRFLADRRAALLGDEMGLGKTVQAITACRVLFRQGKISSACVVCPKAILTNWERELRKWAPELEVIKLSGDKETRANL
jgi:SNF2 family DNA or RNA helicase